MQSIGERLEEARKRKGISLREAAEATKIRGDFLGFIEQNKMDFDLPEIYKRGFLKNYARYLKLDVDKIMTDYNAQQLSNTRLGKKGGAEWFGQMEVKKPESEESADYKESGESGEPARYGRIAQKKSTHAPEGEGSEEDDADKTFYMKIALIFVGTLALVFVVFGLIWAILGSGDSVDGGESGGITGTPELRETSGTLGTSDPRTGSITGDNRLTLVANGNVYVLVKQRSNNQELLRKTMSAGETVTIEKEGAVDILFTAGENIVIEHRGERLRPSSSGTAKITID